MAINERTDAAPHGYICFYKAQRIEVYAATLNGAHVAAVAHFRARKSYEVTTGLAELNGEPVVHVAVD